MLPKALAPKEVDEILSYSTKYSRLGNYLLRRDTALLELLYAAAMRESELTGARLEDFNFEERYLIVRGKGTRSELFRSELGSAGHPVLPAHAPNAA